MYFQHWREADDATETITGYVARMKSSGEWGQHLEIVALSEFYERPIEIYTELSPHSAEGFGRSLSERLMPQRDYPPLRFDGAEPIRLVFCGLVEGSENHYQSLLVPAPLVPPPVPVQLAVHGGLLMGEGAGPPGSFEGRKQAQGYLPSEAARRQRQNV